MNLEIPTKMVFALLKGSLDNSATEQEIFVKSTVQELQQFYRGHGIASVQMKGVGFSAGYNMPHHREVGDIDIFNYSADTSVMNHKEANTLADKLMEKGDICRKPQIFS